MESIYTGRRRGLMDRERKIALLDQQDQQDYENQLAQQDRAQAAIQAHMERQSQQGASLMPKDEKKAAAADPRQALLDARDIEDRKMALEDRQRGIASEEVTAKRLADKDALDATESKAKLAKDAEEAGRRDQGLKMFSHANSLRGVQDGTVSLEQHHAAFPDTKQQLTRGQDGKLYILRKGGKYEAVPDGALGQLADHMELEASRIMEPKATLMGEYADKRADRTAQAKAEVEAKKEARAGLLTPAQLSDKMVDAEKFDATTAKKKDELEKAKNTAMWGKGHGWWTTQKEQAGEDVAQQEFDAASTKGKNFRGLIDRITPPDLRNNASTSHELENGKQPLTGNEQKRSLLPVNPTAQPKTDFNTPEEAEAANLPIGTKIRIGGRPAIIE